MGAKQIKQHNKIKVMEIIKDSLSFINSMVVKSRQAFPNGV